MKKYIPIIFLALTLLSCKKDDNNLSPIQDFTFTEEIINDISYKCIVVGDQVWMAENLKTRLPGGLMDGSMTYNEEPVESIPKSILKDALLNSLKSGVFVSGDMWTEYYIEMLIETMIIPEFFDSAGNYYANNWGYYSARFKVDYEFFISYFEIIEQEVLKLQADLKIDLIAQAADYDYVEKYGYLYTYTGAQKVIPEGWRLPTDDDWKNLEKSFGMSVDDINKMDEWRGDIGKHLKDTVHNKSFAAKLGGAHLFGKYEQGNNFKFKDTRTYWWSSTKELEADSASLYIIRGLRIDNEQMLRGTSRVESAYNIRLVKDL